MCSLKSVRREREGGNSGNGCFEFWELRAVPQALDQIRSHIRLKPFNFHQDTCALFPYYGSHGYELVRTEFCPIVIGLPMIPKF